MAIASFVIAVLALIAAAWSYWRSNKNAKAAVAAAKRSADASERSAIAAEVQASLARAAADRYEVPWTLTPASGDMVRLTNTNRVETAFDVRVRGVFDGRSPLDAPDSVDIGPGSSIDFFKIGGTFGQPDTRICVLWRRTPHGPDEPPWEQVSEI